MKYISKAEAELLRKALLRNDGATLCPDWKQAQQNALTQALDKLRLELREVMSR